MNYKKYLKNPKLFLSLFVYRFSFLFKNDEFYLKTIFKHNMGYDLNLDNPRTFNEKLQWLKIHDRNPLYTQLVDKYEVRKYIAEKIGEEYLIPLVGGPWDNAEEIDLDELPEQFVLKCNHDCGSVIICRNKSTFDFEAAKKKLNKALKRNYYWSGREWPYKNVKPRIIAEAYMEDEKTAELRDYKFFCFDGVCKFMFLASERQLEGSETKFDFYDADFNHLPFTQGHPNADVLPSKPQKFEEMKSLASILSNGIPQVRVDFYEANGAIYFGELTFSHYSGFVPFNPTEWDYKIGELIKLPNEI